MAQRYWLWKRNNVYYLEDSLTGKKESLHTSDRKEAQRLRNARNEAAESPHAGLALARAYLVAYEPSLPQRTWQEVMDAFVKNSGRESTKQRRERALKSAVFVALARRRIIETTADNLRSVLSTGGVHAQQTMRCLHNLAIGLGWLPWAIIPQKLWPKAASKPKRAITGEEHQRIIGAEQNAERRRYYQILWEIGASQSDAAELTASSIDWRERTLTYQRKKTGEVCTISIGAQLEAVLRQLPQQGRLFPTIAMTKDKWRAAEFHRRCRILGIIGVTLHSYRYAWAERAKTAGMPERFAQQALGHGSKAVGRAYAKRAVVKVPSLEDYERKIIQMPNVTAA